MCGLLFTATGSAQERSLAEKARLIDSTLSTFYEEGSFNGNVLVAEKGKEIFSKSYGYAEEPAKRKLDRNSIFELASCSKQFTAAGIALLQQQGKLSYDDLLAKWIPEIGIYKGVTIRHLLYHTSGLPDYMDLMDSLWDRRRIANNKDMIRILVQAHPEPGFEPGVKMEYSNTGYALLASVIEAVSGQTYAAFLDKHIFQPLQMKNSFSYSRRLKPRRLDNYALGYVYSDSLRRRILPDSLQDYVQVYCLDGITGDGSVNSTLDDLLKWDRALYSGSLFTPASRELLFTSGKLNDGTETGYGFGWMLRTDPGIGRLAAHSGGWPGYTAYIERELDQDKTIILLQNLDHGEIPSRTIRDILQNKPLAVKKQYKEITLSEQVLAAYTGTYQLAPEFLITISLENGYLMAQATGQQKLTLYPETDTSFFLKVVDAQVSFQKNAAGQAERLILHQNGRDMPGSKIQ